MTKKFYERPLEEVFTENSTYTRSHLASRILKHKLKEPICSECGVGQEWNGKPLTLQVDHINGVSDDHRLDNLRFLCPNCHSQTETFAGGNVKNRKPGKKYTCRVCGKYCSHQNTLCVKCYHKENPKFNWPSNSQLSKLLESKSACQISKEIGVSAQSLYKHLKRNNIAY